MNEELFNKDGSPKVKALRSLRPSAKLAEEERLADELMEAKQSGDQDRLNEASQAVDRYRMFWRAERAEQGGDPDVTAAQPDTIRVKTTPGIDGSKD